jgi:hypothetical protein
MTLHDRFIAAYEAGRITKNNLYFALGLVHGTPDQVRKAENWISDLGF